MKATTYAGRSSYKTLTTAALSGMRGRGVETELPRAAGAPHRILPRMAGSGAPANNLGSRAHRHVFGAAGVGLFLAPSPN
jgi:hypothetical protein